MMCTGYLPTTATSEWTTYETIGGLQPTPEGLIFRPGMFIEAIESGSWLVIDEMNRSNFDRAFGQLFTVLSAAPPSCCPSSAPASPIDSRSCPSARKLRQETDPIRLPATWRIIATMNAFDKNLLFDMSYALMRRFAFIEVGTPSEQVYRDLLEGDGDIVRHLLPLRRFCDLGPAIYLDAARYAERRLRDGITPSRVLYEAFYAYFLPQFEGVDETKALDLYRAVGERLDETERAEVRRNLSEVLGVELLV